MSDTDIPAQTSPPPKVSSTLSSDGDRLTALLGRTSLGTFSSAILVIVTLTAINGRDLDASLSSAVKWYFAAAATAGGGILFDALVDSIFVESEGNRRRITVYNSIASNSAFAWMLAGLVAWLCGSNAVANHYSIDPATKFLMSLFLLCPIGLALVFAFGDSVFVLCQRLYKKVDIRFTPRGRRSK